jgi:hypothetical protein
MATHLFNRSSKPTTILAPVVVDCLELADIATRLHYFQELDDDLAARAEEGLVFAPALGVCAGLQRICEDVRTIRKG